MTVCKKRQPVLDIQMTVHCKIYSYNKSQRDALFLKFILINYTVLRLLMMDSRPARNV